MSKQSLVFRRLLLLGAPSALLVITSAHPGYAKQGVDALSRITSDPSWITLHLFLLLAVGALDLNFALLGRRISGGWGNLVTAGSAINSLFYTAFIGLDGFGGGLLGSFANSAGLSSHDTIARSVGYIFSSPVTGALGEIGAAGWIISGSALFIVWAKTFTSLVPSVLVLLGTILLAISHAPPFGPIGALLILVGLAIADRIMLTGTR